MIHFLVNLTKEEGAQVIADAHAKGISTSNAIRLQMGLPEKDWGFRKNDFDRKLDREVERAVDRRLELSA